MPQDHRSGRHRARRHPDRHRGSRRPAGAHRAEAHLHDPEELVLEDLAFHADIVAATGNRALESLLASVTRWTASARIWWALVKSDVLSWTHEQHRHLPALRTRDSLAAFTAASRHVNDVDAWVGEQLDAVQEN
ncbi:FCD domain-containing protein [Streptomyces sp. PSKA54]|uniref:FCD domain-containing protein n=1 Tax=Streptomyces himalayensis subsp. aureolus TaxID=2758039 RepID=A0A7W2D3E6_9ACTN|nr:FCD domain-containing protein [Streptomyces himalayensis]MBA4863740.1 FCD domain-containing protein [Streptomyces himalayensis subsp. aureolus]